MRNQTMSMQSSSTDTDSKLVCIRASFLDFIDDPWKYVGQEEKSARFYPDGLLVLEDGTVKAFGLYEEIAQQYGDVHITSITGRLIVPGFVDGHVHFGQTRVLGIGGLPLLPWLQNWMYPEEMKYEDPAYAREGIKNYFDNMLASGTTTVQ